MENEELQIALKNRMRDVTEILELRNEGKSSQEISTKTRTAESYVTYVLKSGYDNMLVETSSLYGIIPELATLKEKSSLKKELVKEDKPHPSTNQELMCMDCIKILVQIESVVHNGFTFRMYRYPKCKKIYPYQLDTQGYLEKNL